MTVNKFKKLDDMIAEWKIDNAIGNSGFSAKRKEAMKKKWLESRREQK